MRTRRQLKQHGVVDRCIYRPSLCRPLLFWPELYRPELFGMASSNGACARTRSQGRARTTLLMLMSTPKHAHTRARFLAFLARAPKRMRTHAHAAQDPSSPKILVCDPLWPGAEWQAAEALQQKGKIVRVLHMRAQWGFR